MPFKKKSQTELTVLSIILICVILFFSFRIYSIQVTNAEEFTDKNDLLNCFAFVQHIIENCTDVYPHKYEGYSYGNLYWDELEELYMIAEDVLRSNPDVTGEELKDWYGYYFSRLDASDYQSIIDEVRELNESINDEKDIA